MPSSTSSSNDRLPRGPWGRTWLLALAIALVVLTAWEVVWRRQGFTPAVRDDGYTWSMNRARVRSNSIVAVGTSRIQTAVDPDLWAEEWGESLVQLAIAEGSPLPIIENLAADLSFAGLVIFDFVPRVVFDATGEWEPTSYDWLQTYAAMLRSPAERTEAWLRPQVESRLVLRNSALAPRAILSALEGGSLPRRPYGVMRRDRFQPLDFSRADAEALARNLADRASTQGRPASGDEVEAIIERVERAAAEIRARGGDVIFVQFPRTGSVRAVEEQRYPTGEYWDALAAREGDKALNSEHHAILGSFRFPDGSHIDRKDVPAFTRGLARLVEARM